MLIHNRELIGVYESFEQTADEAGPPRPKIQLWLLKARLEKGPNHRRARLFRAKMEEESRNESETSNCDRKIPDENGHLKKPAVQRRETNHHEVPDLRVESGANQAGAGGIAEATKTDAEADAARDCGSAQGQNAAVGDDWALTMSLR